MLEAARMLLLLMHLLGSTALLLHCQQHGAHKLSIVGIGAIGAQLVTFNGSHSTFMQRHRQPRGQRRIHPAHHGGGGAADGCFL